MKIITAKSTSYNLDKVVLYYKSFMGIIRELNKKSLIYIYIYLLLLLLLLLFKSTIYYMEYEGRPSFLSSYYHLTW